MNKEIVHGFRRHSRRYRSGGLLTPHNVSRVAPDRPSSLLSDSLPNVASLVRPKRGASQTVRGSVRVRPMTPLPQGPGAVSQELACDVRDRRSRGLRNFSVRTGACRSAMGLNSRVKQAQASVVVSATNTQPQSTASRSVSNACKSKR